MRPMHGVVCLQGGAEFRPGCEPMDSAILHRADGAARRVLVAPFAGARGREREGAAENARRWYLALGARDVVVALDEADAFVDALADAELLVLPGGSPSRLLDSLGPHEHLLRSRLEQGMAISGASAGAMVLCRWTVLPGAAVTVAPALGLVPVDLALPHYRGAGDWLEAARPTLPADPVVVGLPERSGVVIGSDGEWEAVGVAAFTVLTVQSSSTGRGPA